MSAKSKDTTKTAHVMNLLRKNTTGTPQTENPVDTEEAPAPIKPAPVMHPIITSLNEEAAVSMEIKDALELELEKSERRAATTPVRTQFNTEQNLAEDDAVEEEKQPPLEVEPTEIELEREAESGESQESADCTPEVEELLAEEPKSEEPLPEESLEEASTEESEKEIFNVMQVMVNEAAQKYMTMFGLCCCARCKADVRALALNNLQPKYVVMEEGEYIPRITLYEQQFKVAVTAQILRACDVVAKSPRHPLP